jgi:small conductance mechanosensitive channel
VANRCEARHFRDPTLAHDVPWGVGVNLELGASADAFVRLYLIPIAWRLAGAVVIWLVGSWVIKLLRQGLRRFMRLRTLDPTLAGYLDASVGIVLQLLVVIVVLGVLGVETTSFAALLAAAGLAIGAAWSGLLANFAAGLFLLTFRPFKVGDQISAAGVTGTVREIGLFVTSIDTNDLVLTFVGNNKLFSENVQNFSANRVRRVDLTIQLPVGCDATVVTERLIKSVRLVPHVLLDPPPTSEILSFTAAGPIVTVRPFCLSGNYWQVYFDTNRAVGLMLQEIAAPT